MKNLFIGKLNRKEFIIRIIMSVVVAIITIFLLINLVNLPLIINHYRLNYEMPLVILIAIFTQVYQISLYIRRLNDIKLSPWITLVTIIKPLDFILFLILIFIPSKN